MLALDLIPPQPNLNFYKTYRPTHHPTSTFSAKLHSQLNITKDNYQFNTHIDNITKKCIGTLFQCKRAIGPTWGLSLKVCHWIYTAIIRPTLAYCSIVWIRGVENKNNTKRLERVQGMALKYMAGAMPSTPYTALNYLTGTPHITDYLKEEAAKGAVRLMGQGDWTLETAPSGKGIIKAHSTLSNNFLHTLNINKHDSWDITNLNSSSTTATLSPTQQPHSQRTIKTDSTLTS